jgi:carboxymethylenebutenolidase
MDLVLPAIGGIRPAVMVLHGSGGVSDFPEDVRELANRGYITLAPHYFESTGTSWADLDSIRRHGLTWGQTVLNAVECARGLPNVDPQSIGLLGFSLGGYLAVAVAAHDRRIKCVAEFFGGVPERFLPSIEQLPPTLIVHGEDDDIVPVRHALELKQLCDEKGFYFEMELYPGAGHNFSGASMHTAIERVIAFLDQRLKVRESVPIFSSPA